MNVSDLPTLNALLNTSACVLLLVGYAAIRRRNIALHRKMMAWAFGCSTAFLIFYLYYHAHVGSVRFQRQGWMRPLYFSILISHTILAALVPPLALVTIWKALKGKFEQHRKIARYTLPIWIYVSFTGVVIYWMLYRL